MLVKVSIHGQEYDLEVQPTDKIQEIKSKINELNGTPVEQIHPYIAGHAMKDGTTISDYPQIVEGSKIQVRVILKSQSDNSEKSEKSGKSEKDCILM
ncbi:ubiquitin-like protein [Dictyostelium discoideum AX4]|uniref:Ubiquitin-like protein NEDD8-like protein 1 n=1 Tax=Dictyostelium discoideum TaxID=44689 RepID=NED81_DICDI|nr:ubiquitin-like protein [Dictyostelium discoideum AX4]Q54TK0.1 RecName: Full=NEDD8-like protein 1 [Dictyostelium discoideum]EAL66613.1 ubiquitin-like protein [Dictyostelium discoideum AX4]|eukprot:XP_640591.1 ubiquitin-like protein [Dictyostelium discoideum AX4]